MIENPIKESCEDQHVTYTLEMDGKFYIVEHVPDLKYVNQCICGEIVDRFPLAQSTISQHLRMLKDAGLIQGTIEGPRTCYCVDHDRLNAFKEMAKAL